MRRLLPLALIALLSPMIGAQQQNDILAGLSINGTGRVSAAGVVAATSSRVIPTPTGSAPIYHHRAAPGTALAVSIQGTPGLPVILIAGNPTATPIAVGSDLFELDLAGAQVVVDGLSPISLYDLSAFTGPQGAWKLVLPGGLTPGFGQRTFQGIVYDPTASPFNLRFTASLTLEVVNDLDTIARNFTDGLVQVLETPSYLASCCSSGFLQSGFGGPSFVGWETARALGLLPSEDPSGRIDFRAIGPDTPSSIPLPTGAPTTGQTVTAYYEAVENVLGSTCSTGLAEGEIFRLHGIGFTDEFGVWKMHGNQLELEVEAELSFTPGGSNPQGLDCVLLVSAEDSGGQRGGIFGVTVTGPQLGSISTIGQATSDAIGTVSLSLDELFFNGGSLWTASIQLADASAGTSRLPRVVNASGIRDAYDFLVTWNDGTTSGPYPIALRAAIDAEANPAAAVAAIPGGGAPGVSGVVVGAGTANAVVNLTFPIGTLTASPEFSHVNIELSQIPSGPQAEFPNLFVPAGTPVQTLGLCAPGFTTGSLTSFFLNSQDVYGTSFFLAGVTIL